LNSEVEQLSWRRSKILELSSQGHTERDIAAILQVALGTVNRDLQILKKLAQANISKYINETLPLEYQKCMIGLDAILVKSWSMANDSTNMQRDKLQALSIAMQAYEMKLELLSSATVVERAVHFVNKHRGLIPQNGKVLIDGTAEPIANTG
jgi:DNA-binding CsgD family transcriptional regulator